jgi:hypothetical protein
MREHPKLVVKSAAIIAAFWKRDTSVNQATAKSSPQLKSGGVLRKSCIIGHLLFEEPMVNCEHYLTMLLTHISALLRLNQHLQALCHYATHV